MDIFELYFEDEDPNTVNDEISSVLEWMNVYAQDMSEREFYEWNRSLLNGGLNDQHWESVKKLNRDSGLYIPNDFGWHVTVVTELFHQKLKHKYR